MADLEKIFENIDPVTSFNLRQEFLNVLIHSADVSNPSKPLEIYKQWAKRCVDEFFKQGDMEKRLGMAVSFNCDRDTVSLPQSQVGFIDAIVFPLFSVICEFFPGLNFTLENMGKNLAYYKGIKENESKKKIKEEIKEEDELDEKKESAKSSDESKMRHERLSNDMSLGFKTTNIPINPIIVVIHRSRFTCSLRMGIERISVKNGME